MKYTALIAALLTAVTLGYSQALPVIKYEIEANYQQTQELEPQSFSQGSSVVMDFSLRQGGKWLNLTGLTAAWYGQETATATQRLEHVTAATVTTSTPHYFRIVLDSGATGTARTNWLYSLVVSDATPSSYTIGQGSLDIVAGTWSGPAAVLVTPTVEAYLEARLDGIEGEITTNVLAELTWENVTGKPTAFPVASDATLTGTGETNDVLAVAASIVSGASLGATAVQPATLADYSLTSVINAQVWDAAQYPLALTNPAAFATAAQGATADNALPKAGGVMTGAIEDSSGLSFDASDRKLYVGSALLYSLDWGNSELNYDGINPSLKWTTRELYGDWTTTGTNTATAFAYPLNRRSLGTMVTKTNDFTITYTDGDQWYHLDTTGTVVITTSGPPAGYESDQRVLITGYATPSAVTWTNALGDLNWAADPSIYTNSTERFFVDYLSLPGATNVWLIPTTPEDQQ